jgi:predicted transcriptional regulator
VCFQSDGLKARVAAVAELAGKTAHAFIIDAIAQTVDQVEQDNTFHAVADQRWEHLQSSGKTVPWDAARTYLQARARGERPRKPG